MRPYYADALVTLYHGDCREALAWLQADVLLTDPPYGIAYNSGHGGTLPRSIAGDEDTTLRDWALASWGERPALVFGTWRRPRPASARMLLVWDTKGALGMGDLSLPWKPAHQEVYVLGSGFAGHRGTDVLSHAPVQSMAANGRVHPHEKPLGLLSDLISKCPPGVIADPFAGSGSTLRAAKDLGRRAIGIEIEERYCEVAAKRLAQEVLPLAAPTEAA
jgi:DNA modification methylase